MSDGTPPPPPLSPTKHLLREMDDVAREFYRRLAEGQLATTRCEACARTSFPPRLRCPKCAGEQGWVDLPRNGRLYAFTTQEAALRFRAPAVLALAEVDGVVLPGITEVPHEDLRIGGDVLITMRREAETGLTLLDLSPVP